MAWRWVWVLAVVLTARCDAGNNGGSSTGILSGLGESCTKTAECAQGLACIVLTCTEKPGDVTGGSGQSGGDATGGGVAPGGDDAGPPIGRSGEGESCGSSGECAGALRCLAQVCQCEDKAYQGLWCDTCKNALAWPDCGGGCDHDDYCNVSECALSSDLDCNPAAPCDPGSCGNNKFDPKCECNYYGGVCETVAHCSVAVCLCDTDCTPPDGSLKPGCIADSHCDSWCPKDSDPDCAGSSKNGAKCAKPTCSVKTGYCNAQPGTTNRCTDDPDCNTGDPCEGDGWCDGGCPKGADPDC